MLKLSIAAHEVDTISPAETVQIAAARMRDHLVGCLVVTDDAGRPVGMLTDRDLATRVVAVGLDPTTTTVGQAMTSPPSCVLADDSIDHVLSTMQRVPCRRAPVVDAPGRLVGLVTLDDVLAETARRLGQVSSLVRRESPAVLDSGEN